MGTSDELGLVCTRPWLGTLRLDLLLVTQLLRDLVPLSARLSTYCRSLLLLVAHPSTPPTHPLLQVRTHQRGPRCHVVILLAEYP